MGVIRWNYGITRILLWVNGWNYLLCGYQKQIFWGYQLEYFAVTGWNIYIELSVDISMVIIFWGFPRIMGLELSVIISKVIYGIIGIV